MWKQNVYKLQIERNIPRASDIWRNKVQFVLQTKAKGQKAFNSENNVECLVFNLLIYIPTLTMAQAFPSSWTCLNIVTEIVLKNWHTWRTKYGEKPTKNNSSLKVKEFLASRIDQDDQTTEKESEFLTEKENEGEEEEKYVDDTNWVTLEAEDGQSFEAQEDEGGFLLPDTFLSPPLGNIVVGQILRWHEPLHSGNMTCDKEIRWGPVQNKYDITRWGIPSGEIVFKQKMRRRRWWERLKKLI